MTMYRIWSVEHNAWWKGGRSGYTKHIHESGKYTLSQANTICHDANKHGSVNNPDYNIPNETMVGIKNDEDDNIDHIVQIMMDGIESDMSFEKLTSAIFDAVVRKNPQT